MIHEELLTRKEVSRLIKMSARTVTRWCEKGKFPRPIYLESEPRWIGSEVDLFLTRKRIQEEISPTEASPVKKRAKKSPDLRLSQGDAG